MNVDIIGGDHEPKWPFFGFLTHSSLPVRLSHVATFGAKVSTWSSISSALLGKIGKIRKIRKVRDYTVGSVT